MLYTFTTSVCSIVIISPPPHQTSKYWLQNFISNIPNIYFSLGVRDQLSYLYKTTGNITLYYLNLLDETGQTKDSKLDTNNVQRICMRWDSRDSEEELNSEDGGSMFLRNVGIYLQVHTASHSADQRGHIQVPRLCLQLCECTSI
jgi:hypothetical protein